MRKNPYGYMRASELIAIIDDTIFNKESDKEIASKSTGLGRFATYFLITSLANHPEKTVGALLNNPIIKMTDVVNTDGTINVDELYSAARTAMERSVSITVAGITFTVPDVDKIYNIIQRG